MKQVGIMLDMSRNGVMTVTAVEKFIDIAAAMGYTYIQLYTEDTYEVNNNPYFGYMRGAYTKEELKEMSGYATKKGLELIPCVQTLAHLRSIFRWDNYGSMCDYDDILLAGDERTYQLIEDIFATLKECFTSRRVHIGMDEAHMVGLGKYLDKHGYENRSQILLKHLEKVVDIATKYGLKPMMWSDMFFRLANNGEYYGKNVQINDEVKKLVPQNLQLVYWDYYSTEKSRYDDMIKAHKQFNNEIVFAGGVWSWTGFMPENNFSIKASRAAMKSCVENGIEDVFATMWGDNGSECSYFSLLPALLCFAEFSRGNFDMASIKEKFFSLFNIKFDDFMKIDLLNAGFGNKDNYTDPSKYMLYADVLCGFLDPTVPDGMNAYYKKTSTKLKKMATSREFGYIFEMGYRLSRVLEIKCELGIKARTLYKNGDKVGLKALADNDIKTLIKRVDEFYNAFKTLWYKENKSFGFEVQDIRLGGLKCRLTHVRQILLDCAEGKSDKIEELEIPILPYKSNGTVTEKQQLVMATWGAAVTACVLN